LDKFLLDKFVTRDTLLFKGFGIYFTENVLSKHLVLSKSLVLKSYDLQKKLIKTSKINCFWRVINQVTVQPVFEIGV